MPATPDELLRRLPAVEAILNHDAVARYAADVPRPILVEAVRAAVQEMRDRLRTDGPTDATAEEIRQAVLLVATDRLAAAARPHFRRAINATGIILHTGLGRAVLPPAALRQIANELTGYSLLQLDIETGQRSRRDERIEALLRRLTGADAATVVNNNAAATMVVLSTVGRGREIIVSRGQLVEIGGSFRLPEVMEASGARLVEVGTTNKTHARDYERAITENTAAILRVHPSNYRIVGFTAEVPLDELVAIAHAHGLVLIDDVGAGALVDFSRFGFDDHPTLMASIAAGADLVTASTDKLIGGPQGGLILGRTDLVQAVRKSPLARVVRVDKVTLAALEATLSLFLDEQTAMREVPTLRLLQIGVSVLSERAERMAAALGSARVRADVAVIDGASQMGSGSLPGESLPTRLVAIRPHDTTPVAIAERLRRHEPPIVARIHKEQLLLDPRTLLDGEDEIVTAALVAMLANGA